VEHNVQLEDRVGNKRQYDVVMRGTFAGRPVLGVIECKDHKNKKGPAEIEAFAKKTENLGANLRIIVSRNGFTDQALRLARHEHIGCFSLIPGTTEPPHLEMGDFWYGIIAKWTTTQLVITYADDNKVPLVGFDSTSVKLAGKSVLNWFLNELFNTHAGETMPGPHRLTVRLASAQTVDVAETQCRVTEIACVSVRVYQKKRRGCRHHFAPISARDLC
jgi:hypothetical protein